jgi:hypothetical protein
VAEVRPKIETPTLRLPDGTIAQIEVMGQGQQIVAYGIHPDTRREYEWPDSGPDVVPLADLPVLDVAAERTFLAAAEGLIRDADGRTDKEAAARVEPKTEDKTAGTTSRRSIDTGTGSDFFRRVSGAALAQI